MAAALVAPLAALPPAVLLVALLPAALPVALALVEAKAAAKEASDVEVAASVTLDRADRADRAAGVAAAMVEEIWVRVGAPAVALASGLALVLAAAKAAWAKGCRPKKLSLLSECSSVSVRI